MGGDVYTSNDCISGTITANSLKWLYLRNYCSYLSYISTRCRTHLGLPVYTILKPCTPYFFPFILVGTLTCPILVPLVPLFWISSDVSSRFQSQSWFCLIHFCGGECNIHSLRSTSGATPADLLTAGMATSHFPTCIRRGRSWLRIKRGITHSHRRRMWHHCASHLATLCPILEKHRTAKTECVTQDVNNEGLLGRLRNVNKDLS